MGSSGSCSALRGSGSQRKRLTTEATQILEAHRPSLALYRKISTVKPGVLIFCFRVILETPLDEVRRGKLALCSAVGHLFRIFRQYVHFDID